MDHANLVARLQYTKISRIIEVDDRLYQTVGLNYMHVHVQWVRACYILGSRSVIHEVKILNIDLYDRDVG